MRTTTILRAWIDAGNSQASVPHGRTGLSAADSAEKETELFKEQRMSLIEQQERAREAAMQAGRLRQASTQECEAKDQNYGGEQMDFKRAVPLSERLTLGNVDDAFRYQPWGPSQADAGEQVRDALVAAAKAILRNVPETPTRTRALNCLIDARMLANAAISFHGRF